MSYQLLKALYHLQFPPSLPVALCDPLYDWLMEEASMTVRLEQYCQRLQVVVINEDYCTFEQLLTQEKNALSEGANSTFWLREVILTGDNLPWLAGRTIIPQETLQGPQQQLLQLGNQPLGRYLFASPALSRDYIEPGNVDQLWGRRSLLRLTNKPLLLTELFLPDSPLYLPLAEGYKPCDLP